jgi:hypothetical protein
MPMKYTHTHKIILSLFITIAGLEETFQHHPITTSGGENTSHTRLPRRRPLSIIVGLHRRGRRNLQDPSQAARRWIRRYGQTWRPRTGRHSHRTRRLGELFRPRKAGGVAFILRPGRQRRPRDTGHHRETSRRREVPLAARLATLLAVVETGREGTRQRGRGGRGGRLLPAGPVRTGRRNRTGDGARAADGRGERRNAGEHEPLLFHLQAALRLGEMAAQRLATLHLQLELALEAEVLLADVSLLLAELGHLFLMVELLDREELLETRHLLTQLVDVVGQVGRRIAVPFPFNLPAIGNGSIKNPFAVVSVTSVVRPCYG